MPAWRMAFVSALVERRRRFLKGRQTKFPGGRFPKHGLVAKENVASEGEQR